MCVFQVCMFSLSLKMKVVQCANILRPVFCLLKQISIGSEVAKREFQCQNVLPAKTGLQFSQGLYMFTADHSMLHCVMCGLRFCYINSHLARPRGFATLTFQPDGSDWLPLALLCHVISTSSDHQLRRGIFILIYLYILYVLYLMFVC